MRSSRLVVVVADLLLSIIIISQHPCEGLMSVASAIKNRFCCKIYKKNVDIAEQTLKNVLALTQRAPTCFNSQPYVVVVVRRDQPANKDMVPAMFASNKQRVQDAPITVVFCADLEPSRLIDSMSHLSEKIGYNKDDSKKMVSKPLNIIGPSGNVVVKWLLSCFRAMVLPVMGIFQPVMTGMVGESTRTWAIKQTMFPASTFLIAATDAGFATAPMEGFDSNRIRKAVGLPKRYLPALVVSCGYPEDDGTKKRKETLRFDSETVFFDGNYATPFKGIEPVVKPKEGMDKKEQ